MLFRIVLVREFWAFCPIHLVHFKLPKYLKIILEIGSVLSGKLLLYDALQYQTQIIDFSKNPREIENGLKSGFLIRNQDFDKVGATITQETFLEKCRQDNCVVIDIREAYEEPKLNELKCGQRTTC